MTSSFSNLEKMRRNPFNRMPPSKYMVDLAVASLAGYSAGLAA